MRHRLAPVPPWLRRTAKTRFPAGHVLPSPASERVAGRWTVPKPGRCLRCRPAPRANWLCLDRVQGCIAFVLAVRSRLYVVLALGPVTVGFGREIPSSGGSYMYVSDGAGADLQTTFDESGLSTTFLQRSFSNGSESTARRGFSVGAYQIGTRSGYGAAEKKSSWNAASQSLLWTMSWGTVECQFTSSKAVPRVDLKIVVHNTGKES